MKYFKITLIAFLSLACSLVFADASELQYKRVTDLPVMSDAVTTSDIIPIYDRSANRVKQGNPINLLGMNHTLVEADTTITAADSGTTYAISATPAVTITLPAPSEGLNYKFVSKALVSSGSTSNTVVTASSANIILGGFTTADIDGAADVDWEESGGDTVTHSSAADAVGDWFEVESDGTNWYIKGASKTYNALTVDTAS